MSCFTHVLTYSVILGSDDKFMKNMIKVFSELTEDQRNFQMDLMKKMVKE